ncbi:hypothetical protein KZZ08_23800, partial [Roseovarius mucosus]|uniref:hypothetical protein n=1 Tax=Roseovarius mucosus TaxID=215743 RepID=UPI001C601FBB
YLTKSRPDILALCSYAATKAKSPTVADKNVLLDCVKYLYVTQDHGLILPSQNNSADELTLQCHVDASYLSHPDSHSH